MKDVLMMVDQKLTHVDRGRVKNKVDVQQLIKIIQLFIMKKFVN